MRRLLLLDTIHNDLSRHHGAEFFPFLVGMARERGRDAAWWCVPVPDTHMHVGGRFIVDLPPRTLDAVAAALAAWPPDTIVVPYRPTGGLAATLASAAPGATVVDLTAAIPFVRDPTTRISTTLPQDTVAQWLFGAAPPERTPDDPGPLLGDAPPVFGRRWLGAGAPPASFHNLRVAVESGCAYGQPATRSAPYDEFAAPAVTDWRGCAFCHKRRGDRSRAPALRDPPVARALAQIRAHQRDDPRHAGRTTYVFDYGPLSGQFDGFLRAALDAPLAPSTFVTMMRADTLVARRPAWEALLPRLAAAGHRLSLISIGAENFSAAENERFNKGVTTAQLWECVDLLEGLAARYPDTLSSHDPGYFSVILFTPWTTPDDLRANVTAARRLGAGWLNRALGTRLQLWEGTPITALAERDGLIAPAWFDDATRIVATSASGPDDHERPWRFADPRTRTLHRLLIRLAPIPWKVSLAPDDPLVAAIAAVRAADPWTARGDYVALVAALIDAVDALGPDATLDAIFAWCRAHPPADPALREGTAAAADGERATGAPCVTFAVGPPGRPPRYEFRVSRHRDGERWFHREGALVLVHGDHTIDRPAEIFVAVLRRAMRRLQDASLEADGLDAWRAAVARLLDRAGLAAQYAWEATPGVE